MFNLVKLCQRAVCGLVVIPPEHLGIGAFFHTGLNKLMCYADDSTLMAVNLCHPLGVRVAVEESVNHDLSKICESYDPWGMKFIAFKGSGALWIFSATLLLQLHATPFVMLIDLIPDEVTPYWRRYYLLYDA